MRRAHHHVVHHNNPPPARHEWRLWRENGEARVPSGEGTQEEEEEEEDEEELLLREESGLNETGDTGDGLGGGGTARSFASMDSDAASNASDRARSVGGAWGRTLAPPARRRGSRGSIALHPVLVDPPLRRRRRRREEAAAAKVWAEFREGQQRMAAELAEVRAGLRTLAETVREMEQEQNEDPEPGFGPAFGGRGGKYSGGEEEAEEVGVLVETLVDSGEAVMML